MDTVNIRNDIQNALSVEANTHELAALLYRRIHRLHNAINLSKVSNPHQHIFRFVQKFISRTPDILDILMESARHTPQEDLCEALAETCVDFFSSPPPILSGRTGLNGMMGKSYLSHRIIEEINDYIKVASGIPLLPLDFTCSNLVVHQLIGEPFANLLDELVHDTSNRLQDLESPTPSPPQNAEAPLKVLKMCRNRALLDEIMTPSMSINSRFPSCTIH